MAYNEDLYGKFAAFLAGKIQCSRPRNPDLRSCIYWLWELYFLSYVDLTSGFIPALISGSIMEPKEVGDPALRLASEVVAGQLLGLE